MQIRVLVAEADKRVADEISQSLISEGYEILVVRDAVDCLKMVSPYSPSLIVMDTSLPSASGFAICRLAREQTNAPILLIHSSASEIDRMFALEVGADDCLGKPIDMVELVARARMLVRPKIQRSVGDKSEEIYTFGDLTFFPERYDIRKREHAINLTQMEVRILRVLAEQPNRFLIRQEISLRVWGESNVPTNRIASAISRLRAKIEDDPTNPTIILGTMSGSGGYKLAV